LRRRQAIPATFLRREWDVPTGALRDSAHGQPHRSTAEDRLFFVRSIDPAIFHKGGLAHAGVWEMEPLTDRRVVEFSLSLAPDQLIANGAYRPVARQALSDRLPTEVLDSKKRGMQSADWHLHFRKESAMAVLDEVETNATVQAVYDVPALREAAAAWPERLDRWDEGDYLTYASSLPFALNTAVFLMETEKGWSKPAAQQARRRAAGCKRG
jgi:asparagine synthase (glutamine-hydrolysing)